MTKFAKLQKRIAAAVARARKLGYQLVADGAWGVEYDKDAGWVPDHGGFTGDQEVCICGAIALSENPSDGKGILPAIAKKYGITIAQAASLSDGFENYEIGDGWDSYPKRYKHDQTWYRIGRKWRERADVVRN